MKFEELFYLQLHILRYSRERGRRIRGHVLAKSEITSIPITVGIYPLN